MPRRLEGCIDLSRDDDCDEPAPTKRLKLGVKGTQPVTAAPEIWSCQKCGSSQTATVAECQLCAVRANKAMQYQRTAAAALAKAPRKKATGTAGDALRSRRVKQATATPVASVAAATVPDAGGAGGAGAAGPSSSMQMAICAAMGLQNNAQLQPAFSVQYPKVHLGTSGFIYDWWYGLDSGFTAPNVKVTSANKLAYYMQFFNSVELNVTFYQWIKAATWLSWRMKAEAQAPLNPGVVFKYVIKAHKFFTHTKKLILDQSFLDSWDGFYDNCTSLGPHLGLVLFQFPPSFRATSKGSINNAARLQAFIELLRQPKYAQGEYAFEFRNSSWYTPTIYNILRRHGKAAMVMIHAVDGGNRAHNGEAWFGDLPNGYNLELENDPLTATGFTYTRMHGASNKYMGSYGAAEMSKAAKVVSKRVGEGRHAYLFFNNTDDRAAGTNMPSAIQDVLLLSQAAFSSLGAH